MYAKEPVRSKRQTVFMKQSIFAVWFLVTVCFAYPSTLNMKSVNLYQTALRNISEDNILHNYHSDDIKSRIFTVIFDNFAFRSRDGSL
jgi:hypothetical protein